MILLFEFAKEIEEQPGALQNLIENIPSIEKELSRLKVESPKIAFIGMGSSLYAAIPSVYLLRKFGIDADYFDASEVVRYFEENWIKKFDICVLVSQSGETFEIRKLIAKIRNLNLLKIGVTAHTKSHLGMNTDVNLDILSGEEKAIGSTKTHTNSVVALIVFSLILTKQLKKEIKNVRKLPNVMAMSIRKAHQSVKTFLKDKIATEFEGTVITSTGFALGEIYQSALTLNEISRTNVLAVSTGMLRHGPMELFVDKRGFIQFVPDSKDKNTLVDFSRMICQNAKFTWIVSNGSIDSIPPSKSTLIDSMNFDLPEYLQSISFLPYMQILSYEIRKAKGIGDDEFHLIRKVTTEGWNA